MQFVFLAFTTAINLKYYDSIQCVWEFVRMCSEMQTIRLKCPKARNTHMPYALQPQQVCNAYFQWKKVQNQGKSNESAMMHHT